MNHVMPRLKGLSCLDIDDLETFDPGSRYALTLRAMFGPVDGPGAESFDIKVYSVEWIDVAVRSGDIFFEKCLITKKFDFAKIRDAIIAFAGTCGGRTWEDVASNLSRIGCWEFEDYRS